MMWLYAVDSFLAGVIAGLSILRWYCLPQLHKAHLAEMRRLKARHLVELVNIARIARMPDENLIEAFMMAAHERARQR